MFDIYFLIVMFSIDNFLVSTSYSIKKISISLKYIFIICLINTLSLSLALFCSNVLELFMSQIVIKFLGFIILFSLGIYNMFQDKIKDYFSNKKRNRIINVYLDETSADFDNSKNLSLIESFVLALILSLDSLFGGISIGLLNLNTTSILIIMFIINFVFFLLGKYIGRYLNECIRFNFSYICGFIIILVALINFI